MTSLTRTPDVSSDDLRQRLRQKIDALSYLPTTAAVAIKFLELGKDPDAGPVEYANVLSADGSLSAKLLSLSNSSWFGVRNKVTTVKGAVNLLGLSTVRTLAISYCMTGLHNELGLEAEESRLFWEASLCKAVAAKQYVSLTHPDLADEAFVGGMFQDLAVTVLYATSKEPLLAVLQNPGFDAQTQLQKQRDTFGIDHAEAGRMLAQKLDLPEALLDCVAFHHDQENLGEFVAEPVLEEAYIVASLFPHLLNAWNRHDADQLCRFLEQHTQGKGMDPATFLTTVQDSFETLYRFFEEGKTPQAELAKLMEKASREAAENTEALVATVHQLLQQAARAGATVSQLVQKTNELEERTIRDPLTGVLNRNGFDEQAGELVNRAVRYGSNFAVVFLDLDRFKTLNDQHGHKTGDVALKHVADCIGSVAGPQDLVARLGGDEFVALFSDCDERDATRRVKKVLRAVAAESVGGGKRRAQVTLSAGCLSVRPSGGSCTLESVTGAADKLMYQAKRAGGNQVQTRTVSI
jgi:diguanylate cyclase (GGDEF)-like protein